MNELDDEVAELFARDEPITDEVAFAAEVRAHVDRRRLFLRAATIGVAVALVALAVALVAIAPSVLAFAPNAVQRLSASPVVAVLAGAVMFWWNRSQEA